MEADMSTQSYINIALPGSPGGPLLFLFHGTGGNEEQLVPLGRELLPGATIVSPRGDVSESGAARFFRRTGEGVYDLDDLVVRTAKMAAFVKAHRDAAKPSAVIGLGYSNGANILASVVFAEPALFDAAVLMHPLIPFEPRIDGDLMGKRLLVTAGRRDPICPPSLTSRLEAYLRAAKADVTVDWHEGGHELRANEIEAAKRFLSPYAAKTKETSA
jgi:phospholipase/carboxylesterase